MSVRDRANPHCPPRTGRTVTARHRYRRVRVHQRPLAANPHRIGKELDKPYHGVYSARLMQKWRILYVIDETQHRVTIRDISHRRDAYRTR